MTKTVEDPDKLIGRTLAPLRHCTLCEQRFAATQLTWVAGRWFCKKCHQRWTAKTQRPEGFDEEDGPASFDRVQYFNQLDSNLRFAVSTGRFGGYGLGFYLASTYDFFGDFMQGVLMADFMTWLLLSWFDIRFHKLAVVFEFLGFVLVSLFLIQSEGSLTGFETNEAMGIGFLGFLITFSTKGLYTLHRYWHGQVGE